MTTAAPAATRGYFATVGHGYPIEARILVNGIPVHFVALSMEPGTRTDPVNQFLVPGDNAFAVEVDELPAADWLTAHIRLDHEEPVTFYRVPRPFDRRDDPPPYRYATTFQAAGVPSAPYAAAPPAEFDAHGTAGQRAALERLHATLRAGGADALHDELRPKFEHLRACYGSVPRLDDGLLRARYRAAMDAGCDAAPLPADLEYRRAASGRVACVVRRGGEWALSARFGELPFRTNVYLMHEGRDAWSVIF